MLDEAKKELKKADIKVIPIIKEIKKIAYYFEVKFKKIGKFKNTYDEILIILKDEVEEKKRVEEYCHSMNKKYLDLQKEINYYFGKDDTSENLINNKDKDKENGFIEIRNEENEKEEINVEEIKEEEYNEEEEFKEVFDDKFNLEQVKSWLIKNWFIFIFFLFFFMLGFLVGKI